MRIFYFAALIVLIIVTTSCKKEGKFDIPVVHTGEVTNITPGGAVFHGRVLDWENNDIIDHGFVWATHENPVLTNANIIARGRPNADDFKREVRYDFKESEDYFVRAFVKEKETVVYGRVVYFRGVSDEN